MPRYRVTLLRQGTNRKVVMPQVYAGYPEQINEWAQSMAQAFSKDEPEAYVVLDVVEVETDQLELQLPEI